MKADKKENNEMRLCLGTSISIQIVDFNHEIINKKLENDKVQKGIVIPPIVGGGEGADKETVLKTHYRKRKKATINDTCKEI